MGKIAVAAPDVAEFAEVAARYRPQIFRFLLASLRDPSVTDQMLADCGPDGGAAMMSELVVRGGDAAPAALVGMTLGEIARQRDESCATRINSFTPSSAS